MYYKRGLLKTLKNVNLEYIKTGKLTARKMKKMKMTLRKKTFEQTGGLSDRFNSLIHKLSFSNLRVPIRET